jgi:hypothetical protein
MLIAIALTWRFRLSEGKAPDFTPSMHWEAPLVAEAPEPDSGPVMVTIEYRVDPAHRADGAFFWELFHDSAEPARYLESFMDESWTEHLRQHERVSVADREIQRRANRFLATNRKGSTTASGTALPDLNTTSRPPHCRGLRVIAGRLGFQT